MKKETVVLMVGVALMAWGGAGVNTSLRLGAWQSTNLAIFAVGILMIAHSYVDRLEARVATLEATIAAGRDAGVSQAGA